jgi:hypothetical protein
MWLLQGRGAASYLNQLPLPLHWRLHPSRTRQKHPHSQLLICDQAELKIAVKKLISTLEIKTLDRERIEREGLMHYDQHYKISPY